MKHASELLPAADRLTKEQGWPADSITDVFVSIGPGSFTGLRIGVSVARTLAFSIGARIVAVPTVDVLARNGLEASPLPVHLAVVLDAKRQQVYAAAFDIESGKVTKTIDACLADPADFFARCPRPLAVLGEGVAYHRESVDAAGVTVLDESLWPARAENVFHVGLELAAEGRYTPGAELMPLYIRRPEAEEKWEKLRGKKQV
jgi:tRNA threonylcarbamoyladenosine biosynthesis protein TsaB